MARKIAYFILIFACGSCMEMRETVERMVMVRTTGSDLQPAATGYIYKKDTNGPASVVKMGEVEVMEHLSKLSKPEAYIAPVPAAAGPFHEKEIDGTKAASHASESYIPVVENSEENVDDHIEGIASEDYGKIFEKPNFSFDDDHKDFSDYLHRVGHFGHKIYHDLGDGQDHGLEEHQESKDKDYKGYAKNHKYGKGGAGDYRTEKYESFSVAGEGGLEKHYADTDAYRKNFDNILGYKRSDHGHKFGHGNGKEIDGYHKLFDKDEFKNDHDFFDGEKHEQDFHKHGNGHEYHGSNVGGVEKGRSHDSGHHEDGFGKEGFTHNDSGDEQATANSEKGEGESTHHQDGDFSTKNGKYISKSYSYDIKH